MGLILLLWFLILNIGFVCGGILIFSLIVYLITAEKKRLVVCFVLGLLALVLIGANSAYFYVRHNRNESVIRASTVQRNSETEKQIGSVTFPTYYISSTKDYPYYSMRIYNDDGYVLLKGDINTNVKYGHITIYEYTDDTASKAFTERSKTSGFSGSCIAQPAICSIDAQTEWGQLYKFENYYFIQIDETKIVMEFSNATHDQIISFVNDLQLYPVREIPGLLKK